MHRKPIHSMTKTLLLALMLLAFSGGGAGCVEKRVVSEKSYAPGQFPETRRIPYRDSEERQKGYQPYHSGRADTVGGATRWRAK